MGRDLEIPLLQGSYVTLVVNDAKDCYGDNNGQISLAVATSPCGTISSTVRDGAGNLLPNVSVAAGFGNYTERAAPKRWGPGDDNWASQFYANKRGRSTADVIELSAEPPPDLVDIDFALTQGGSISGHVYASPGTMPIEHIHVYAEDYSTGEWTSGTYTAENGSYTMSGLPRGDYRVRAYPSESDQSYVDA